MDNAQLKPLHCLNGAAEAENNPAATLKSPRHLRAPVVLVTVERTPAENRNCRAHCVDLVTVEHGQPVTTTERVAAAAGLKHASVIKLVRDHLADFEELGTLRFQIAKSGGRPTEYAELNEQQAALLFLYQRNTAKVRAFKMRMLKDFARVTAELNRLKAMQAAPEWQAARTDSKRGYRFMTRVTHELRIGTDKPATTNTHIAEAGVIAFAMTGDSMDRPVRDKLPPEELRLLDHVQFENGILIARGLSRPDRKKILRGVVLQDRADRAVKIGGAR